MGKFIDLTGKTFGRLFVLERAGKSKEGRIQWLCQCNCPEHNKVIVIGKNLTTKHTKSCGCLQKEQTSKSRRTHGESKSALYRTWKNIKNRCYNSNVESYRLYGGKENPVLVCEEWLNGFEAFYDWSIANGYQEGLTIERVDSNGNYEPNNCKWATAKEQANNTNRNRYITYNGETKTMAQWAEKFGIKPLTLRYRLTNGWPIERALTEKPIKGKNQYNNKTP